MFKVSDDYTKNRIKFIVNNYVCNTIEIEPLYDSKVNCKCTFNGEDIYTLRSILDGALRSMSEVGGISQAKTYNFGNDAFDRPYVMLYKDKKVFISDGRGGNLTVNGEVDLLDLINTLRVASNT